MSVKYKLQRDAKKHDDAKSLLIVYNNTFHDVLDCKYAVSKVVQDPEGSMQLSPGKWSETLSNVAKVAGIIPVAGTVVSGVIGGVATICGMWHIHQIIVKARYFTDFVNNVDSFDGFVDNIAKNITNKHAAYIGDIKYHEASMKKIHSISEKLADLLGKSYDTDEQVKILATYHAQMVVKAIEKGLDPDYQAQNMKTLKHQISDTFVGDHDFQNTAIMDHMDMVRLNGDMYMVPSTEV